MKDIALRRLNILTLHKGEGFPTNKKLVFHAELASLGYRLKNGYLLDEACPTFFLEYQTTLRQLTALRGGEVSYVPLFTGFPNKVPDEKKYFVRRIIGYLGNVPSLINEGRQLDSGFQVPEWLFDLKEFGADPISQFQDKGQWERAKTQLANRKADSEVVWRDLEIVLAENVGERLKDWARANLYAGSSIKETLREDLARVLEFMGPEDLNFDRVILKENRALVWRLLWKADRYQLCAQWLDTPTDVLRLFAAITDTDINLSKGVRVPKLKRSQRRLILEILSEASNLEEDLKRYRGLWLLADRYIHSYEFHRQYPRVALAFKALREGTIVTFDSICEKLMASDNLSALLAHLSSRPGVFGRKLHEVLRRFPKSSREVLSAFSEIGASLTVKQLLVLKHYFATINEREYRAVINKLGKLSVIENNSYKKLNSGLMQAVVRLIEEKLMEVLQKRESWYNKGVWIDPDLVNYTVPLQQRATSDGMLTFGRGSRIPVDLSKVLRLFVYWKEQKVTTDLDLSLIQFDENFGYRSHVSFSQLTSEGIVHSGDLQSAPHGAAEFIDVDLSTLKRKTRYLAVSVLRFTGETFSDLTAHAGWMVRDHVDADYQTFDIKTVENKMDLNGCGAYVIPLIVDLRQSQIITTDLYMNGRSWHNTVEGTYGKVSKALLAICDFVNTRPNMKTLAESHMFARAGYPCEENESEISFGVSRGTFNAADTHTILAELI